MAIKLSEMRENLTLRLNDAFAEEYDPGWAVYIDYHQEDMSWRIGKVERWSYPKHAESMQRILRVPNCRDELEAYVKALKQLEQDDPWKS